MNVAVSEHAAVVTCTPFSTACVCDVAGAVYTSELGGPAAGVGQVAAVDGVLFAAAVDCAPVVGVAAFFDPPPHAAKSTAAAANAHIRTRI